MPYPQSFELLFHFVLERMTVDIDSTFVVTLLQANLVLPVLCFKSKFCLRKYKVSKNNVLKIVNSFGNSHFM